MAQVLLIIGLVLAAAVIIGFLPRWSARSTLANKKVRATLDDLGCTREKDVAVGEFEGEHYELLTPYDKQPARLRLDVPGVGCGIRVTKNDAALRFLTRISFSGPIESGDAGFDHDFYVESTDREFTAALLRHGAVRARMEQLMPATRHDIRLGGGRLVVPLPRKVLAAPDGAARIRDVLRPSRLLAAEVRKATPNAAPAKPRRWPLSVILVFAGMGLGMLSGSVAVRMMGSLLPQGVVAAMKLTGWISLGAFIALQVIAVCSAAGRSDAHRMLVLSFFGGLLSIPTIVAGCVIGGNAVLDRSPVRRIEVPVRKLEYDEKAKKGGGQWDLYVSSWHEDRRSELVHPTKDEAAALKGSTRVAIEVRDGAFGWERILSVEPAIDR